MALKQDAQIKYTRLFKVNSLGILPKICSEKVLLENCIRVSIVGEASLIIRAKMVHEKDFTQIGTLSTTTKETEIFDTSTWDMLEYEIVSINGNAEIAVAGFFFKKNKETTANTNKYDNKEEFIAGEILSALKVVRLNSTNQVVTANTLSYEESQAIGITCNAANVGEKIEVVTFGRIEDPSFSFTGINTNVFLDTNGNITEIPPSTGQYVVLGQSLGTGAIFLSIDTPIELC